MGAERLVQEPLPRHGGNGSCRQSSKTQTLQKTANMAHARRSTSWQVNGNAMHSLLYPVCNEREAMRRQGLKPKDHAKENVRRIQELQRLKTQVLTAGGCLWRRVCGVCGRVLAAACV
jgi:ssDNA-binding Zn-finger/Zn-ribbon topoisomerase 1